MTQLRQGTQLSQALSRGFIQEMGVSPFTTKKNIKHSQFFVELVFWHFWSPFSLFFIRLGLHWNVAISDSSNQSRLQKFECLLQHPFHPWVKATLLDALQLWRDQHAHVREASWRNKLPMQTWGKCELCCLESLYHLILEGEVCVFISWLYFVSYYVCRCIHILCVWEY